MIYPQGTLITMLDAVNFVVIPSVTICKNLLPANQININKSTRRWNKHCEKKPCSPVPGCASHSPLKSWLATPLIVKWLGITRVYRIHQGPIKPHSPSSLHNNDAGKVLNTRYLSFPFFRLVQHNGRSSRGEPPLLISVLWTSGVEVLHHHPRLPLPLPQTARLHLQDSIHRTPQN